MHLTNFMIFRGDQQILVASRQLKCSALKLIHVPPISHKIKTTCLILCGETTKTAQPHRATEHCLKFQCLLRLGTRKFGCQVSACGVPVGFSHSSVSVVRWGHLSREMAAATGECRGYGVCSRSATTFRWAIQVHVRFRLARIQCFPAKHCGVMFHHYYSLDQITCIK